MGISFYLGVRGATDNCVIRNRLSVSIAMTYPDRKPTTDDALDFSNLHSPLPQLRDILRTRHRLVGRLHAARRDAAVGLHQAGDRERIARGAHHGADAPRLVVVVEQLPRRA